MISSSLHSMFAILILAVVYFLPALIAAARDHYQTCWIVLLNLLAAITGVTWIIALIWSLTPVNKPSKHPADRYW